MKKQQKNKVIVIFQIIAAIGAVMLFGGEILSIRDNQNYTQVQKEISVVEPIDSVLFDEQNQVIYVGYDSATCVNAYTTDGEFAWAVSVPFQANGQTEFYLYDGALIIEAADHGFYYNAKTGEFIKEVPYAELDVEMLEDHQQKLNNSCEYQTDGYSVYRTIGETSEEIISKPFWHIFFNRYLGILIMGIAIVSGFVIGYLPKKSKTVPQQKITWEMNKGTVKRLRYIKVITYINIAFAALNLAVGFFFPAICIGFVPVILHFIVAGGVFISEGRYNLSVPEAELSLIEKWKRYMFLSILIPVLSLLLTVGL